MARVGFNAMRHPPVETEDVRQHVVATLERPIHGLQNYGKVSALRPMGVVLALLAAVAVLFLALRCFRALSSSENLYSRTRRLAAGGEEEGPGEQAPCEGESDEEEKLRDRLEDLENKIEELNRRLQPLRDEIELLQFRVDLQLQKDRDLDLEGELNRLEEKEAELEQQLSTLSEEKKQLEEKLLELEEKQLKEQLEELLKKSQK